jgi:APA family basic amino acid/polyamine antiporter
MGFSFGLVMAVVGFAAPLSLMAYTFASFFAPFLRDIPIIQTLNIPLPVITVAIASITIVILTWLHTKGYEESEQTQAVATLTKIVILVSLAVLMLMLSGEDLWKNLHLRSTPTRDTSFVAAVAANLTLILYAYTGWNSAAYMTAEIKDPTRGIKISLIGGTLMVTLLYVIMNLGFASVFSPLEIQALSDDERNAFANTILQKILASKIADAGAIILALGMIASISAVIVSGSRLIYAMALEALLPKHLLSVCPKSALPKAAIWMQSIVAMLLLLSGSFESLLNFAGFGLVAVSMFVILPIFRLRGRDDYRPSFRIKYYPALPLLFILSCVLIFTVGAVEQPLAAGLGLLTVVTCYLCSPRGLEKV